MKGAAYTADHLYRPWAGATIKPYTIPASPPPPSDIIVYDNYRIAAIISDGQRRDNVDEDLLTGTTRCPRRCRRRRRRARTA